jgi:hypothetical protein
MSIDEKPFADACDAFNAKADYMEDALMNFGEAMMSALSAYEVAKAEPAVAERAVATPTDQENTAPDEHSMACLASGNAAATRGEHQPDDCAARFKAWYREKNGEEYDAHYARHEDKYQWYARGARQGYEAGWDAQLPTADDMRGIMASPVRESGDRIKELERQVDKWHSAAMKAGVIVHVGGALSFPERGYENVDIEYMAFRLFDYDTRYGHIDNHWTWPEHPEDDGHRGEGGYVNLAPNHIQTEYRNRAKNLAGYLRAKRTVIDEQGRRG